MQSPKSLHLPASPNKRTVCVAPCPAREGSQRDDTGDVSQVSENLGNGREAAALRLGARRQDSARGGDAQHGPWGHVRVLGVRGQGASEPGGRGVRRGPWAR